MDADVRSDEREKVSQRDETIFALSSGHPPAAIAVIRISGTGADQALLELAGRLPEPRQASLATLRNPASGEILDQALCLRFPGPNSATGEDLAELHLHGGRSVVAGVLEALGALAGFRAAAPGEFTRRAFANGRIDLAEAEGLADLLQAETRSQRRAALALARGGLSRLVADWQNRTLALAAKLESILDFSDEDDVEEEIPASWRRDLEALVTELEMALSRPPVERLRDGIRVVIAGPPNAGKSTLLNALAGRSAAITSAIPGTTRDVIEAPAAIGGTAFLLIDTAGLRETNDEVEQIGVGRAKDAVAVADLILWLGDAEDCPEPSSSIVVQPKADLGSLGQGGAEISVSALTGTGIEKLTRLLVERSRALLPAEDEIALNARHRAALSLCLEHLRAVLDQPDVVLAAESLRQARTSLDGITGRAGVEDMLDTLFGRFCIGK